MQAYDSPYFTSWEESWPRTLFYSQTRCRLCCRLIAVSWSRSTAGDRCTSAATASSPNALNIQIWRCGVTRSTRILAFGKWGTYKRPGADGWRLFKEVVREIPEARLVIAGTDHPKTPGYLHSIQEKLGPRSDVIFTGYVAEDDIPQLFQSSSVAVLPYTSSAGSSGIAHLACTYGVPIVASDIPDFRRLADEEGLAIDFFPAGQDQQTGSRHPD